MIGVIDYGAGNIQSVRNALEKLGVAALVSNHPDELKRAQKIILPGVGEARNAMGSLNQAGLPEWLRYIEVPFLGICIGMQILFERSAERDTPCMGIVRGNVEKFNVAELKVPHMGWNQLEIQSEDPLFRGIRNYEYFYFVHSYYAPVVPETIGVTNYDAPFSAVVKKNNFYGVQFHAEKSGSAGLQILKNFIDLC